MFWNVVIRSSLANSAGFCELTFPTRSLTAV